LFVRYRWAALWLVRNEPANEGVTAIAAATTAATATVAAALGVDSLLLSKSNLRVWAAGVAFFT
jgi:hypothetical protein